MIWGLEYLYQRRENFKENRVVGKDEILGKIVFENYRESKLRVMVLKIGGNKEDDYKRLMSS